MLLLLLGYIKITFQLRKCLFIGCVKACNTILMECLLSINSLKDEERRELINMAINLEKNYMKKTLISEAQTTPLIHAIYKKDRQLINFLLSEDGIDINLLNSPLLDQSPLFAAVSMNDVETVINLVEKGVNKSIRVKGVLSLENALQLR